MTILYTLFLFYFCQTSEKEFLEKYLSRNDNDDFSCISSLNEKEELLTDIKDGDFKSLLPANAFETGSVSEEIKSDSGSEDLRKFVNDNTDHPKSSLKDQEEELLTDIKDGDFKGLLPTNAFENGSQSEEIKSDTGSEDLKKFFNNNIDHSASSLKEEELLTDIKDGDFKGLLPANAFETGSVSEEIESDSGSEDLRKFVNDNTDHSTSSLKDQEEEPLLINENPEDFKGLLPINAFETGSESEEIKSDSVSEDLKKFFNDELSIIDEVSEESGSETKRNVNERSLKSIETNSTKRDSEKRLSEAEVSENQSILIKPKEKESSRNDNSSESLGKIPNTLDLSDRLDDRGFLDSESFNSEIEPELENKSEGNSVRSNNSSKDISEEKLEKEKLEDEEKTDNEEKKTSKWWNLSKFVLTAATATLALAAYTNA